jgi:hypothetical protein
MDHMENILKSQIYALVSLTMNLQMKLQTMKKSRGCLKSKMKALRIA